MNQDWSCLDTLLACRPHVGEAYEVLCKALLREFFLREMKWLHSLRENNRYYCVDLTSYLSPQQLPQNIQERFYQSGFSQSSKETQVCLNYLRWQSLKSNQPAIVSQYRLPEPYEPLIEFFRAGGEFSIEQHIADIAVFDKGAWRRDVLDLRKLRDDIQQAGKGQAPG